MRVVLVMGRTIDRSLVSEFINAIRTSRFFSLVFENADKVLAQRPSRYVKARLQRKAGMFGSIQSAVDNSFFFLDLEDIELRKTIYVYIVNRVEHVERHALKITRTSLHILLTITPFT